MTTRKIILIDKYSEFLSALSNKGINAVFPSLEDIDLVDLLYFFDLKFSNSTDYKATVIELIEYSPVKLSNEEINDIYPIIETFINYLLIDFKKLK